MSNRNTRPSEETIREAIAVTGSLTEAAAHLGVTRQTLWRWLRDLSIKVERRTQAA